uniref:Uncharacterized protein n=1 Tax=Branchiostoma floridae TaxID=7739 RepID=C3XS71_BRAFL|eukprot:XP_002613077.1 hypothetical protein BRAFLDRAFT_89959 [Branchiostoma floridae]
MWRLTAGKFTTSYTQINLSGDCLLAIKAAVFFKHKIKALNSQLYRYWLSSRLFAGGARDGIRRFPGQRPVQNLPSTRAPVNAEEPPLFALPSGAFQFLQGPFAFRGAPATFYWRNLLGGLEVEVMRAHSSQRVISYA